MEDFFYFCKSLFGIVIVIVFQSVFYLEMSQKKFKNYF